MIPRERGGGWWRGTRRERKGGIGEVYIKYIYFISNIKEVNAQNSVFYISICIEVGSDGKLANCVP